AAPVHPCGRYPAQHPGAPVPPALLAELLASTRISGGAAAPRAGRAEQRPGPAALQRPQQPQPANTGIAPRARPANLVTGRPVMPDLSYSQHLLNLLAVGAEQQAEGLGSSSRLRGVFGAGPRAAALAGVEPGPVKAQTPALCEVEEQARAEAGLQRWSLAAEQCCVCLDTMGEGQTVRMLSCGHRLHSACLRQYLHGRHECVCPMCRAVSA
ncbi:RING-type domain-containing protein, partial [Haematococcus lacustris]